MELDQFDKWERLTWRVMINVISLSHHFYCAAGNVNSSCFEKSSLERIQNLWCVPATMQLPGGFSCETLPINNAVINSALKLGSVGRDGCYKETAENKIWPICFFQMLLLQVIPKITRIETYGENEGETSFIFVCLYIWQESDPAPIKVELVTKKMPLILVELLRVYITTGQWDKGFTIQPGTSFSWSPQELVCIPNTAKRAGKPL